MIRRKIRSAISQFQLALFESSQTHAVAMKVIMMRLERIEATQRTVLERLNAFENRLLPPEVDAPAASEASPRKRGRKSWLAEES